MRLSETVSETFAQVFSFQNTVKLALFR